MPISCLLVKFTGAYVYLEDAPAIASYGVREGYIELDTESRDLAIEVGTAVLGVQSQPRFTAVVDPMPRLSPDYGVDFTVGDHIAGPGGPIRIVGVTITSDDEGRASSIPELVDPVTLREQEVDRLLRRLADGGLRGKTEQSSRAEASPPLSKPGRVQSLPPYSYDGLLVAGLKSMPWSPPGSIQLTQITLNLRVAGSSTTGVSIVDQDGNNRASATIAGGRKLQATEINPPEYVAGGQQLMVEVQPAGTGAEGLTVQTEFCSP